MLELGPVEDGGVEVVSGLACRGVLEVELVVVLVVEEVKDVEAVDDLVLDEL